MRAEFAAAAATYDAVAVLGREVGRQMEERLDYLTLQPARIADIGCATGDGILALARRYPRAQAIAVDYALPMLATLRQRVPKMARLLGRGPQPVNADVNALPLASGSLDLIWSNLMLQWLDDPLPALRELHRCLRVDGVLMFATLGPDTVRELRQAAQKVGAGDTARRFIDMHDWGDMLLAAGFSDPVMDMEMIRFNYPSPRHFLAHQRQIGVRDSLLGQRSWRDWRRLFSAWERDGENFPITFEIVYGQAWRAAPRRPRDGQAVVRFHR